MTQYQYLRTYLNQNVCCPNCKLSFYAVEMPTSPTDGQNLKMGCEKSQTDVVREEAAAAAWRESSASKKKGARLASNAGSSSGNGGVSLKVSCVEVNVTGREMPNQLGTGFVSGDQVGKFRYTKYDGDPEQVESVDYGFGIAFEVQPGKSKVDSSEKALEIKSMSVPDPEFYNFDKDRIEKCFGENQVWAVYDNEDGMPRYYALIRRVISKRPFEIELSCLHAKSQEANRELDPAAMPLEFLQVITEDEEREMAEKAKEAKKDLHLGESSEAPLKKKLLKT
ncbi:hypothetical protein Acr_23g0003160 [Actinidia rufa]|uniref:DUF3444 domain-containing protein n=1 Tax=Actinidia rufa TaxID=165716 RepID=A0A7J0GMF0_9ERIC|nr:hypothetical protein Acr_23g0003160 [Actinidia rufa]